jgi:uncharacterized delta-60 repeat protein
VNGQLVGGFGEAGVANFDPGTADGKSGAIEDLKLLSDGKIVVAGSIQVDGGDFLGFVARLTATGELDPSFGEGGVVRRNPTSGREMAEAIDVLPDGRLLVAGLYGEISPESAGDTWVLRLTAGGQLDPTFAGDGEAVLNTGNAEQAEGLAIQPDGRAVVGGWASSAAKELMVARLTADELPEPTPAVTAKCSGRQATIVGTGQGEKIQGTKRRDVIAALGGRDRIKAGGGRDLICAGAGRDSVRAGAGSDTARGEAGTDSLFGQAGRDKLLGGKGNDRLFGGGGAKDRCIGGAGKRDRGSRSCERARQIP